MAKKKTESFVPPAIVAHAKRYGFTVVKDARRNVGIYRRGGKDLISFNLSDAKENAEELITQLNKQIVRLKADK